MREIRKYINLIESCINQDNNDLIEDITQLDESFKVAEEKFSEENSDREEIKKYIIKYKDLSDKGIIKGKDKDISKWIKAGWYKFKSFVEKQEGKETNKQYKRKLKKDSIFLYEDDNIIIMIPLTEKSSCYYGRNTQWCTSSTTNNYFNDYFVRNFTIFYIFVKSTNKKFAVTLHNINTSRITFYNENDNIINKEEFEKYTKLDHSINKFNKWNKENLALINKKREKLKKERDKFYN